MRSHRVSFVALACALSLWTGCSSPTRPAEVIPGPALPLVPDVRPAAGTHPYRLTLRFPPCMNLEMLEPELWSDERLLNFVSDNDLVVQGTSLHMTLPDANVPGAWLSGLPPFHLDLQRSGNVLSGTMGGETIVYPRGNPNIREINLGVRLNKANWKEPVQVVALTGTADNDGRFSGTFDGYFHATHFSGGGIACQVQGATFTLEPLS